jgi:hypothetical protein
MPDPHVAAHRSEPDWSITRWLTGNQKSGKNGVAGVILTRKTWLPARGGVRLDLKEALHESTFGSVVIACF